MRRCCDYATSIICRGSGGQPAHPAGSARGGARSHVRSARVACVAGSARGGARSRARSNAILVYIVLKLPQSSHNGVGMTFTLWFLIAGGLLIFMALAGSVLKRLPLSTAMVYLAVGLGLGPLGLGLLDLDIVRDAALIERVAEVAVLISLFSAGLKLRMPLSEGRWRLPGRLAIGAMMLTVGLIALVGFLGLGLPLGAAILLGGMLAP